MRGGPAQRTCTLAAVQYPVKCYFTAVFTHRGIQGEQIRFPSLTTRILIEQVVGIPLYIHQDGQEEI